MITCIRPLTSASRPPKDVEPRSVDEHEAEDDGVDGVEAEGSVSG